jgi:hypothetical protein
LVTVRYVALPVNADANKACVVSCSLGGSAVIRSTAAGPNGASVLNRAAERAVVARMRARRASIPSVGSRRCGDVQEDFGRFGRGGHTVRRCREEMRRIARM